MGDVYNENRSRELFRTTGSTFCGAMCRTCTMKTEVERYVEQRGAHSVEPCGGRVQ